MMSTQPGAQPQRGVSVKTIIIVAIVVIVVLAFVFNSADMMAVLNGLDHAMNPNRGY